MSNESILRGIKDKRARDVVRRLLRAGWTLGLTGSNHLRLRHPSGAIVVGSMTASTRDAWRRLEKDAQRVEEAASD